MQLFKQLYINRRFFLFSTLLVMLYIFAFFWPKLLPFIHLSFYVFLGLIVIDLLLLYRPQKAMVAQRTCAEKFSNSDDNEVAIHLRSFYHQRMFLRIIDELPIAFQIRNFEHKAWCKAGSSIHFTYHLRPVKRGNYHFGNIKVFAQSSLGLLSRSHSLAEPKTIAVYPSFVQMHQYELLAMSHHLQAFGVKKIRRIGNNMEFEQIKNYVNGDDYRKVNWKATARKGELMINQFQNERSQPVYSVIDKGRLMQMPFNGLSLLDYAINASLVISKLALKKGDKAGIITFQHKLNAILQASDRDIQMHLILEHLYKQKTAFKESNFGALYGGIKRKISQRSLMLLYTNFESMSGLNRQLPHLRQISKYHLLVCIIFENTEVAAFSEQPAEHVEEVYTKGIAEQMLYEKRLIAKTLRAHGIYCVITSPQALNVNTINQYLELKSRGLI